MKSFKYVITDPVGLHARPAGILSKKAKEFESKIIISKDSKEAEATKLMAIMSLGVKQGDEIDVRIEGTDEEIACAEIESFCKSNF